MNGTDGRFFIYPALILVSVLISVGMGFMAGLWSFLQIVAVMELVCWLGLPDGPLGRASR